MRRSHETWHDPAVAQTCKEAWTHDLERTQRATYATLLRSYVKPGMSLLDAGCGTGLMYGELVPDIVATENYTGVDIASPMLDIARNDFPEGRFHLDDLYHLSYADDSFDAVICFEVLGHLPEIKTPISEMIRVARKLVVFSVWNELPPFQKTEAEENSGAQVIHQAYSHEAMLAMIGSLREEQTPGAVAFLAYSTVYIVHL
jgi:ubiquinone/menaquinone biosynthesis C-methylase UbiE